MMRVKNPNPGSAWTTASAVSGRRLRCRWNCHRSPGARRERRQSRALRAPGLHVVLEATVPSTRAFGRLPRPGGAAGGRPLREGQSAHATSRRGDRRAIGTAGRDRPPRRKSAASLSRLSIESHGRAGGRSDARSLPVERTQYQGPRQRPVRSSRRPPRPSPPPPARPRRAGQSGASAEERVRTVTPSDPAGGEACRDSEQRPGRTREHEGPDPPDQGATKMTEPGSLRQESPPLSWRKEGPCGTG